MNGQDADGRESVLALREDCRRRLLRRIQQLDDQLEVCGVMDRRGRVRHDWLTALAALARAVARLEVAGTEPRSAAASPLDQYLETTYGNKRDDG
jgi:hypothetical protein